MTAAPVLKAASGGLTRRLLQTSVIVVVLATASAAAALGMSLFTNANEAFTNGFASHHGADLSVVDTSRATAAQLAGTRHVAGIGVLKSIGLTPWQVASSYLAQIGAPAIVGAVLGTVAGNLWAGPMLDARRGCSESARNTCPCGLTWQSRLECALW